MDVRQLVLASAFGLGVAACQLDQSPGTGTGPIHTGDTTSLAVENLRPGNAGWRIARAADTANLAVWASPYEVTNGDLVTVRIRSTLPALTLTVYRIGWYGGAGGRVMTQRVLSSIATFPQAACTPGFPGPVTCPWTPTDTFRVADDWVGGLYLIEVSAPDGTAAAYPFVMRSGARRTFAAVVPQFTWQAYNAFGGSSLYTIDPGTGHSVPQVSFERPFADLVATDTGSGAAVIPAVQWLEREGVDVSYISDLDLADSIPLSIPPTHGFIFLGHDEYWTWDEYSAVLQYKAAGRHLAFLGANNAWWNIRLNGGPSTGLPDGLITCYKRGTSDPGATSPHTITTTFQSTPLYRTENALYGIIYRGLLPRGARQDYAVAADSLMGAEARQFVGAAGLHPGDPLGTTLAQEGDGILRNNGDTVFNQRDLQVLFQAVAPLPAGGTVENEVTFFVDSAGGGVFAAGNNRWPALLDPVGAISNPAAQNVTSAVLQWMSER